MSGPGDAMDEGRMREIRERWRTYDEGCHPAEGAEKRERFEAAHFALLMGDLPWLLTTLAAREAEVARLRKALEHLYRIASDECADEPENERMLVAMQEIARAARAAPPGGG